MYKYQSAQIGLDAELKQLLSERESLAHELARVNKRIKAVNAARAALSRVAEGGAAQIEVGGESEFEITGNIRALLKASIRDRNDNWQLRPLSAPEIKEKLEILGWKSDAYDNPLAVVHTILKRLIKGGQVEKTIEMGRPVYAAILTQPEREAADAEYRRRTEERRQQYWQDREEKEALQRARQKAIAQIAKACREEVTKSKDGLLIEQMEEALEKRGVDTSLYASPASAIMQAFKMLGVRKDKTIGTWNYPAKNSG